jgi:hypothetical protein
LAGEFDLGPRPTAESVLEKLVPGSEASLFLQLPPPRELVDSLDVSFDRAKSTIEITHNPAQANYMLIGRSQNDILEFAWVLPNMTRADAEKRSPLVVRSKWCPTSDVSFSNEKAVRDSLQAVATRLNIIRGWLELESPPDQGLFPYRLALKNQESGVNLGANSTQPTPVAHAGQKLRAVLQADAQTLRRGVQPRFVYLFAFDSRGESKLIFGRNNLDNKLPRLGTNGDPAVEIALGEPVTISKPFGIDTFVLLSTRDAIPDPAVLEERGVRRGSTSPLSMLLSQVATGTRGIRTATYLDWSIERLSIRSLPAPTGP